MCRDSRQEKIQNGGVNGVANIFIRSTSNQSAGGRIGGTVKASHAKRNSSPNHQRCSAYLNCDGDRSRAEHGMIQIQPSTQAANTTRANNDRTFQFMSFGDPSAQLVD